MIQAFNNVCLAFGEEIWHFGPTKDECMKLLQVVGRVHEEGKATRQHGEHVDSSDKVGGIKSLLTIVVVRHTFHG